MKALTYTTRSRGLPDDLHLEARDCFTLWRAMVAHQTSEFKLGESLSPSEALPRLIRKENVIIWESELKKVLKQWMSDVKSPFEAMRSSLTAVGMGHRDDVSSQSNPNSTHEESPPCCHVDLLSTTLPMLSDLHHEDALPAILFNYDRSKCEKICRRILEQLKAAEASWKTSSTKWAKKMADYELWLKQQRARARQKGSESGVCRRRGKKDDNNEISKALLEQEAASLEHSIWENFDPNAPVETFSFAESKKVPASDLNEYQEQLRHQGQPEWLIEALRRGLGVHHAGMNRKYRQL